MTAPSLRTAARKEYIALEDISRLPSTLCWNGVVHPPGGEDHKSYWSILKLPRTTGTALLAEEASAALEAAKPKVERKILVEPGAPPAKLWAEPLNWSWFYEDKWTIYAEREIPADPPKPSLEERLDKAVEQRLSSSQWDDLLREAAAEIRRLKEARP